MPATTWTLQDAKNRFSEVIVLSATTPQIVTKRGMPTAVVLSYSDYRKHFLPVHSLLDAFRTCPDPEADIFPARDGDTGREVVL